MESLEALTDKLERVSQTYVNKNSINRNCDWFLFKLQEELGELTKAYLKEKGLARTNDKTPEQLKSDVAEELADVFCHVLLFAKHNNIDIEKSVKEKWLKYL